MAMDMELSITGPKPGRIDHTLYCHVMNLEEPLHLQVVAEFKVGGIRAIIFRDKFGPFPLMLGQLLYSTVAKPNYTKNILLIGDDMNLLCFKYFGKLHDFFADHIASWLKD